MKLYRINRNREIVESGDCDLPRALQVLQECYDRGLKKYFDARSNRKYENERKRFTSYFLTFPGGGRLELMHRPDIQRIPEWQSSRERIGYAHLGVELGSAAAVDALTKRLQGDGFPLLDGPRRTGDGYYESMIADPEGNRIVIAE